MSEVEVWMPPGLRVLGKYKFFNDLTFLNLKSIGISPEP
jgi:hypothetical protein